MTRIVKPSAQSALSILRAKFTNVGIEPPGERKHVFQADIVRDGYKHHSNLGAGIRPIQQPSKRKPGRKPGKGNKQHSKLSSRGKHPFVCKQCGKSGKSVTGRREFCDNKGLCKSKWLTAQRKAGK